MGEHIRRTAAPPTRVTGLGARTGKSKGRLLDKNWKRPGVAAGVALRRPGASF